LTKIKIIRNKTKDERKLSKADCVKKWIGLKRNLSSPWQLPYTQVRVTYHWQKLVLVTISLSWGHAWAWL